MAFTPAKAADLGGDCCADLEERVAELEATTVRKGNRVVSVQLYGQVNKAILVWDDGIDSDAYIVDNDYSGTRLGVRGTGSLKPGWTAGYRIEFQFVDAAISGVSQDDDEGDDNGDISFRYFDTYVESDQFGRISLGQGDTATNGIAEINLGGAPVDSSWISGASFYIRASDGTFTDVTWGDIYGNLDGNSRNDRVRYDSPTLYGFILSASWGDDDQSDVALRFSKEWNSIRVAAGIGYSYDGSGDNDTESVSGSASVMHVPTGLYLSGAAGEQEIDKDDNEPSYYYLQGGVTKNFFGPGDTTLYVEYGEWDEFAAEDDFTSEATKYGIGFNQDFDSAAMQFYVLAEFWEADVDGYDDDYGDAEDFTSVTAGTRIKF